MEYTVRVLAILGGLSVNTLVQNAPTVAPPPAASDQRSVEYPPTLKLDLGSDVAVEFVLIKPGEFEMGSPAREEERDDDEDLHRVRITKPFYMAKYETTQAQWTAVLDESPASFRDMHHPVEKVSWDECQRFIKRLRETFPKRTFRLPTEAEWEYACRAGTKTRFSFGDDDANLDDYGWCSENSGKKTHPVGSKRPNPWGLYDMHGNVWEWCSDKYDKYKIPSNGAVSDPTGPDEWFSGSRRVSRGGSWRSSPGNCRSASRTAEMPDFPSRARGFRVVVEVK